jgi:peptide/nickel transport system permease protein
MPRIITPLVRQPVAVLGLGLVALLVVLALAAPWLAPHDPLQVQLGPAHSAPSAAHWLGTDGVGRDCLSRLLHGARVSLPIGLLAVAVAASLGTLLGALAGYLGGAVDRTITWLTDLFLALPRLVLLLAVLAVAARAQHGRFLLVALVLGLTGWMPVVRIVRAQVQSLRERPWVQAARGLGLPWWRILFRHVLPAALPPVMVHASLLVGTTILTEAALSFLGLGVPAPTPTWGNMIAEGMGRLDAWWLTVFPGLAITAAVAGFNLLGDGLRDILARQEEGAP